MAIADCVISQHIYKIEFCRANYTMYKYWLSGHLPIVVDISYIIKAQFVQIVVNVCDCYGAHKYAMENSSHDAILADKLNAQKWCIACQHTIFVLPSDRSFWTRVFIYANGWKRLNGVCICKYLPVDILCGYKDCSGLNQYIGRGSGYCKKCDYGQ